METQIEEVPVAVEEVSVPEPAVQIEDSIPEMSDAELDAFVANILAEDNSTTPVVTEPQFFTKEKETTTMNDLAIITQLLDKSAEEAIALKDSEEKNVEAIKMLEQIQSIADEKQKEIDAVNSLYTNIETLLTPDIARAIATNDIENIPAYYTQENRARVENHPFVGPLVAALQRGEDVDLIKIVKDAISKTKMIPNVASISSPEKSEPIQTISPMDSIVNSMITRNGPLRT